MNECKICGNKTRYKDSICSQTCTDKFNKINNCNRKCKECSDMKEGFCSIIFN